MDHLPAEVIHLICKFLPKEDIANVRLVSSRWSEIASYYLVDTIHFHTSHESFERLKLLAEHPIFHQTITTVVYEASVIGEVGCRHAYLQHFETADHHGISRPEPPSATATNREQRLYERNRRKFDQEVVLQWEQYTIKFEEQQSLLNKSQLDLHVARMIAKFPHAKTLRFLSLQKCQHVMSNRFTEEFGTTCAIPLSADPRITPVQLRPLLLPSSNEYKALRSLQIDSLCPTFFLNSSDKIALIKVFERLTALDMTLFVHTEYWGSIDKLEMALEKLFKPHILKDCLMAALKLENLDLSVSLDGPYSFEATKYLLGESIWPELKILRMNYFKLSQNAFLDLLKRQPVLTEVSISCVELYEGSWISALDAMACNDQPFIFRPHGYILDQSELYDLDRLDVMAYVEERYPYTLSEAICDYVEGETQTPNPLKYYDEWFDDERALEDEVFDMSDHDSGLYALDEDNEGYNATMLHHLTDVVASIVTGAVDGEEMHE